MSRSRERERESKRRATLVGIGVGVLVVIVAVLVSPLGGSLVSAVQNIFIDSSQITDIQVGGEKIDQVVFRGEVLWERTHPIQEYTTANCPTTRTKVYDARDNATYWIQKLADGRCWMLTNLAYGGGGTNTYGDVKTITLNSTNIGATYTSPEYYIPAGANRTMGVDPSTSITGIGQYGYLYNWCAAMGGQIGTAACMQATTPLPDQNVSICPAGWRLPTGNTNGEFQQLTDAIGATTNGESEGIAGATALRSSWLGMYGGFWDDSGFNRQSSGGYHWSSTQVLSNSNYTYYLYFGLNLVRPANDSGKINGFAVRCLAF